MSGAEVIRDPLKNKGLSFSSEERNKKRIKGLFPGGSPISMETKVENLIQILRSKVSDIERYVFLHTVMDSEEALYFAALHTHLKELMPIVYTPTVGEACQKWGRLNRQTVRGLYLTINDAGSIRSILDGHPCQEIDAIVFTDGERILGLGDLGVNGMGIPVGKLALYSALAGINPHKVLPVQIDVGTDNKALWEDPMYAGLKQIRVRDSTYDDLITEFINACKDKYGRHVLLQFEDFGNTNAFRLLENHRHTSLCFNDDIQGTASVALAGLISSLKITFPEKKDASLGDHVFLFYGAGEAGVGIADLVCDEIAANLGIDIHDARKKVWLMDSQGLVTNRRMAPDQIAKFAEHKKHYAHPCPMADRATPIKTLEESISILKPTCLIGVSAQPQTFTKPVVEGMVTSCTGRTAGPVIMALSNPTSKAECTAEQCYNWTNGHSVFISGSPFDMVTLPDGRTFEPGQGNNAYIFPGVGLGALAVKANSLTDEDFRIAARALAHCTTDEWLARGSAYPPLTQIQSCSIEIACFVAENVVKTGRCGLVDKPTSMEAIRKLCEASVYNPFEEYKNL